MRPEIERIYLIGNRGVGKSTVGTLLAQRLKWTFLDSDFEIERVSGRSVAEIFAQWGESEFRSRERQLLQANIDKRNLVTACGGGVVVDPENLKQLANCWCIWLRASADVLWNRVNTDPKTQTLRPRLTKLDGLGEITQLMSDREPLYKKVANLVIDTDSRSPDDVVSDILSAC
jgi:shikimate kinase